MLEEIKDYREIMQLKEEARERWEQMQKYYDEILKMMRDRYKEKQQHE